MLSDCLYDPGDLLYVLYLCARARDHLYDQFGRCLFRDLTQVINIALQVGVWMTPIMWSMEDLGITGILASILKLNPMFYIVQGYRDAFIYKIWFWQRPGMTLYFWAFTLVFWLIGTRLFRKLKIHFADVL